MVFNKASRVVGALATVLAFGGAASAATVGTGVFNLSGTVYVTDTSFLFGYSSLPTGTSADQTAAVVLPTSGSFAGLHSGDIEGVANLLTPSNGGTFGPGPVVPGSSFTLNPWVSLSTVGINLELTGANPIPVSPNPVCSGTAFDTPGSICQAQAGSPVTLQQGFNGVSALISLSGEAYYTSSPNTLTPFVAKFNAAFGNPPDTTISGLLSDLATNGFIRTGYQASFSTTAPAPVPEPASMALIGAGLFGLGLLGKKKFAK